MNGIGSMDDRSFRTEIVRLSREMQKLAAVGALLRYRQSKTNRNPAAAEALTAFVEATMPDVIDSLDGSQAAFSLAFIDLFLEEGLELLRDPDRAPGWNVEDPRLLLAQGRLSRQGFRAIQALGDSCPALNEALEGRFLDVGTGVGGIVVEAVERCPSLQAVGIDIWEPALELARQNVAESPHAGRIEIRHLDVIDLVEHQAYDVIWMPLQFFDRRTAETALSRFSDATKPGGFVVLGHHASPSDPTAAAFFRLRMARTGGHIWIKDDIEAALRDRGFRDVRTASPMPEANFVIGRRI